MKRWRLGWIVVALVVFLGTSTVRAQKKAEPYRPLNNGEMVELGLYESWVKTWADMTAKQKAEVMRWHIETCLKAFPRSLRGAS